MNLNNQVIKSYTVTQIHQHLLAEYDTLDPHSSCQQQSWSPADSYHNVSGTLYSNLL